MGFLKSITKGIGKAIKSVAKGVAKFAKSPIGKLLLNVGLTVATGGIGGLLAKGVGMLGQLGGVGKLVSTFTGFAQKFLGPAQSFLSKSGLGTIASFADKAKSTVELANMAKVIAEQRRAKDVQTDETTKQIITENLGQTFAAAQAQLYSAA